MTIVVHNIDLLVEELNAGNKKAFEEIFNIYYGPLCLFSNKILDDLESSKDVVQEVFVSIWQRELKFENKKNFKTYLYNSVKNNSITYLQKVRNRQLLNKNVETSESEESYIAKRIESEIVAEVYNAIEELPEECKKVFKLSYIQHLKTKDVAEELNISVNTVKTQKLRAKKFLKERLKDTYSLIFFIF